MIKNSEVPRLAIHSYTTKKNVSRIPTKFSATNSNATRKNKIKQNRKNVQEQNVLRRVESIIEGARKNKNPIPFDKYQTILNINNISELKDIGINITPSRTNQTKIRNYKILVLNELITLFVVIIGEILNFTVHGDLKTLRGRVDSAAIRGIEEGRSFPLRVSRYFDPSIPFWAIFFVVEVLTFPFRLFFRGGSAAAAGAGTVVGLFAIAFAWTLISSPYIYGFNLHVYLNSRKQEINFMQLLMLTYKTIFSSGAAIEYRNEINFYELEPEQVNYFYANENKFKNMDITNANDTSEFRKFLTEFLEIKLRKLERFIGPGSAEVALEVAPEVNVVRSDSVPSMPPAPTRTAPVRHFLPPRVSLGPAPSPLGRVTLAAREVSVPAAGPSIALALREPPTLSPKNAYLARLEANKAARNAKVAEIRAKRGLP